eukprot:TRINITY_DN11386_c0_g1_i1.p1 TRINITY_DN11386_c0_g1~~TRINITY_DN11386_c0_g1_i1.p1  ORF type:complete len:177 (+),score=34.64 TRINITY_DN11386_c0_g1_i1:74-604(+)
MGNVLQLFGPKRELRLLVLGLDGAGKSTILYRLKHGEYINPCPALGSNTETIQYKNIKFIMRDVGGQSKIRHLWCKYFDGTDAVIFVIDANDRERLDEAKEELHKLMSEAQLVNAALLVFCNKVDLPTLSVPEMTEKLGLSSLQNRKWFIQGSAATTGQGLYQGLEWLSSVKMNDS